MNFENKPEDDDPHEHVTSQSTNIELNEDLEKVMGDLRKNTTIRQLDEIKSLINEHGVNAIFVVAITGNKRVTYFVDADQIEDIYKLIGAVKITSQNFVNKTIVSLSSEPFNDEEKQND